MGISPAEVRLRRLLAASRRQENHAKLLHYVGTMREQLAVLTAEQGGNDCAVIPATEAEAYAKEIDKVAEKIDADATPLDVWELLRRAEGGGGGGDGGEADGAASGMRRELEEAEEEEEPDLAGGIISPSLRRRRFQRAQREERGADQRGGVKLDAGTRQLVGKHRLIQDSLIDEMAIFSEQMKNNSLMMEQSLKDTDRVLDGTEEAVEHSLSAMNRANVRAGFIYKSSWKTGCVTWLILFLMCLVFIFMVGVIRITG